MIRRLVTTWFVMLFAVTPAVRAACEASCVTRANDTRQAGDVAGHCSSTSEPSRPLPADSCRHEHAKAAPLVVTAKVTVSPTIVVAPETAPHGIPGLACNSTAGASLPPLRHLHAPFPVPLRI